MSKKYINPQNGHEVPLDKGFYAIIISSENGKSVIKDLQITTENLPELLKYGVLVELPEDKEEECNCPLCQLEKIMTVEGKTSTIKSTSAKKNTTKSLTKEIKEKVDSKILTSAKLLRAMKAYLEAYGGTTFTLPNIKAAIKKQSAVFIGGSVNELLYVAAIELDKQYKNHISKSKEFWTVDMKSLKPVKFKKSDVKYWNTFPAFRNQTDAILALKVVSDILKDLGVK